MIRFTTYQKPTPLKRPRFFHGHAFDPSKKDKKLWLKNVMQHVPKKPFTEPLNVMLQFYFKRPKSHFRTGKYSGIRKEKAPKFNDKIPDIDNLAKFVLDAMNGVFYKDDKQICQLHCSKNYTEGCNDESYQIITIQPLFNCKTIKCDKLQSKTKTRSNSFP